VVAVFEPPIPFQRALREGRLPALAQRYPGRLSRGWVRGHLDPAYVFSRWAIDADPQPTTLAPDTIPPGGLLGFGVDMPASPQGGNFAIGQAELANVGASPFPTAFAESFEQTINNLVVGEQYTISFWQANAGVFVGGDARFDPGSWDVMFGVQTLRSPVTEVYAGRGNQAWQFVELEFTATAISQALRFTAVDLPGVDNITLPDSDFGGVGLAVDGVSIAVVPAPGTAALLLGSSMLAARRRRS